MPEHAEIHGHDRQLLRLRDLIVGAETDQSDLTREQTKADGDVEQVRRRSARDQQRLDSGQVSAPRELEQLQHEIATLGRRQNELEDIELEIMERLESAGKRLAQPPDANAYGLSSYTNVILTGAKKIEELPAYLQYFDCTLIPFKKNTLTKSIYPLKINEYLAAGRPVVATDFSQDIQGFADVIYIGRDHNEFVHMIDQAIAENDCDRIKARMAVANTNTWTARVERFWDIVENHN